MERSHEVGQDRSVGSTSAIRRIAADALVLSVTAEGHRTVGFLPSPSTALATNEATTVPQCSWERDGPILAVPAETAPLTFAQREESLGAILRSSPFRTEPDLLREFEALLATPAGSGTKIFLWNVSEELNLRGNHDICVAAPPNAWPHETSLRSFLETLYYTDDDMPPAIKAQPRPSGRAAGARI